MSIPKLHIVLSLLKYKVSLAVTFTSIAGYLIFSGRLDYKIIFIAIGVFLLAGGASALNQYQERKFDAKMERTKSRPLPQNKVTEQFVWVLSFAVILIGFGFLYFPFGIIPASLGIFNAFWYNMVYTNLKRITPFAVVPGSLSGAVPVFIGWTAAGGYLFDIDIVLIGCFLFIWQVPHFWLLALKYGEEYQQAGFPSINQSLSKKSIKRIIYVWISATSYVSLMYLLFSVKHSPSLFIAIIILNIWFIVTFTRLSFGKMVELNLKKAFVSINVYMLIFLVLLVIYNVLT